MIHPIVDSFYSANPAHERSARFAQAKGQTVTGPDKRVLTGAKGEVGGEGALGGGMGGLGVLGSGLGSGADSLSADELTTGRLGSAVSAEELSGAIRRLGVV